MSDAHLVAALQRHFGFDSFRPGQTEAMRQVMLGRDSLIVMPTGAGKSLCYQLPALLHTGTTLVISPLIALMKDQVDALQRGGVAATFINSSLEGVEQAARLAGLRGGRWKLCYIAPERLKNQEFREALRHTSISLLAVDEAHCISQWGHDFRPDYRAIGDFVEALGRPPIVALTATATPQVQDDIERQLGLRHPYRQVTGFNRPNLRFDVRFTPGETRKQQMLKAFLDEQPPDSSGVIYVGRRREADELADLVRTMCHRTAVCYHGGMQGWERDSVQETWMSGRASIVVATNAFGMGVDKPDVRFVAHYTIPGTLEAYYQEAGRAGRDGQPAHCVLLLDPADARLHEWFIENDAPSLEELRELYGEVRRQAQRNGDYLFTTPAHLTTVLDWRAETKVRVGMKLLAQVGLVEEMGEQNGASHWWVPKPTARVDMERPLREVEQRRTLKRRLLQTMLDYAQTHECRRQYLLDYFGDATPPVAAWCCDNCQRPDPLAQLTVATTAQEKAPLRVLDAVHHLSYGVGRALLSRILAGSRGEGMGRYYDHPQFGILRPMKQKQIQALVDDLIRERYLLIESGPYPTLALSAAGEQVVARRLAIPTQTGITSQPAPTMRHLEPEAVASTAEATRELLASGLTPQAIAAARGLTLGTIFNHLASLIEQGSIRVEQVVPDETRRLIEAAVREVGTFYLSPIKARLPDEVSYGEIRCVVAAMQRDGLPSSAPATAPAPPPPLLERLLAWRRELAQQSNQPAYFIFSNSVLEAIAEAQPRTLEALEAVRGVGPAKREAYGTALIALIAEVTGQPNAEPPAAQTRPPTAWEIAAPALVAPPDDALLERLRQWRNGVAKEAGVPAYVVFNNVTLQELAARRPTTPAALLRVPGIGPAKAEQFGPALLSLLNGGG